MSFSGDVFEPMSNSNAKQRATLIEWLNTLLPNIKLPINASDEELRLFLVDGIVLCHILNKLKPGFVTENGTVQSSEPGSEGVKRFLSAVDKMGLPRFPLADLEKGSMKIVLEWLLTLRTQFMPNAVGYSFSDTLGSPFGSDASPKWKQLGDRSVNGDSVQKDESSRGNSSFQRALRSPVMAEPSAALIHHVGHKFHEVFQLKQGHYADLPASKISEMMKSNSLDNAPTQSLLSVVNGILDESIERKNGEIPHVRVACLLRKVVQEIERRIATQAEHLRTQNNLFKAREEKYQSRIRVLEALATGTSEETEIVKNQLQRIQSQKENCDEKKQKVEEQDVARLMKEKDDHSREIIALKQEYDHEMATLKEELETARKKYEQKCLEINTDSAGAQQEIATLKQELETVRKNYDEQCFEMNTESRGALREITILKQELETARKNYEQQCLQMNTESRGAKQELEERLKEALILLTDSRSRVKELESFSASASQRWSKKENVYQIFAESQLNALRELRFASQEIKQEIIKTQKGYLEEFLQLGLKIKTLEKAAANYYSMLAENQKLHNELQELKGNIRVYCRIRPFLPGQKGRDTIIEYVGENGELGVTNPSKQGKEGRRSFKFNKVYGPAAKQADVFSDIQPLIQSVLDGYNVCIFAYGQTGSGKTYTMTGPDRGTEEDWGVNYRALNNLFHLSQSREGTYSYEVSVQMVEIYNEQVRDLLSSDASQKRLGILSTSQPNGLAVPDATMYPVKATSDVLHLMDVGLKNRAKGSTALNERSSRSHSIVTIHIRGVDHKSGGSSHSSLHLVDLAGSERVDRSEVTGDRLKEAQHINKSLAALGDVISALAVKSTHIPYRNSKLTQVLQSSLGGQAKTLMFVQLNPDATSHSESLSTLKFAERVSGVELGAAKSNKDGRDVRELMEQVASLKDTIAKKDEEIERLQLQKDIKNGYQGANNEKQGTNSLSDADNEERMTEISDSGLSMGTETEGSAESTEGAKRSEIVHKPTRMAPRISRTPDRLPKDTARVPTGMKNP
ncbi:hypothetical protein M9H77_28988 [Catharanthus roseus]|uniref:Uncharacterized protein n=1 Tax=Catharanthus roseus TaxID=4058 RepID=A0ACC0AII0_CATRO|nr:hypothetical protein M9H77_28988 [Catharanthus roseus]